MIRHPKLFPPILSFTIVFVLLVYLLIMLLPSPLTRARTNVTFINDKLPDTLMVRFTGSEHAVVTGAGYSSLRLLRARSGSGARYEGDSGRLVLWNKGDEITLARNDTLLFTGVSTQIR